VSEQPPVNLQKPLPPLDDARITELARGIVTNQYLVADINELRWVQSLMLMLQIAQGVPPNVGAVLVPVAPHLRGYWTDDVPAVTLQAQYVPQANLAHLQAEITRMNTALWPDAPDAAPRSSTSEPEADPR
jgi:hypothetical protein